MTKPLSMHFFGCTPGTDPHVSILTRCSTRIADANGWSRSSYPGFWNKHGRGQRAVIRKGPSPLWIPLFRRILALPFISEQMIDLPCSVVPTSASLSLVPLWRKIIKASLLFVYLLYVFVHFILCPHSCVSILSPSMRTEFCLKGKKNLFCIYYFFLYSVIQNSNRINF